MEKAEDLQRARGERSGAVGVLAAINWVVLALLAASAGWTGWIVLQNWAGIAV